MAKWKVGWPKQSNNNMGAQSGVNLTGTTVSSQSRELETSSVGDCDATTTPPPAGGGSQTGAQESPSMSDVKLEYNVILPKGKGKAVPNNTVQGGLGHDPPRERVKNWFIQEIWYGIWDIAGVSRENANVPWFWLGGRTRLQLVCCAHGQSQSFNFVRPLGQFTGEFRGRRWLWS